jgi:hypothetical protein
MASDADVLAVRDNIEASAESNGWTDTVIGTRLDAGQSVNRISEVYWRKRAQDFLLMVNISEAGSTRGNDAIYSRMVAQADRYAALAAAEEAKDEDNLPPSGRIRSLQMKRV